MVSLKKILASACLLVLGVAIWMTVNNSLYSKQPTKPSLLNTAIPSSSDLTEIKDLSSKIDLLSNLVNQLAQNQIILDEQVQELISDIGLDDGDEEAQDSSPLNKPERERLEKARFHAQRQAQKLDFDSRIVNSLPAADGWDTDTVNKIEDLFSNNSKIAAALNPQSQCSGSLCRVDIEFPNDTMSGPQRDSLEFELLERLSSVSEQSTVYTEKLANGNAQKTYYFARKGYLLNGTPQADDSYDVN